MTELNKAQLDTIMTPLQDAIQFITARRDYELFALDNLHKKEAWQGAAKLRGFDNVLTVLGNAACDLTERDDMEQNAKLKTLKENEHGQS